MNFRIFLISFVLFLGGIGVLFGISTYDYYRAIHSDDPVNPTVFVDEGSAMIVRWDTAIDLSKGDQYELETKDAIETKAASKATITWPDHSTTRLGANSRIVISKMEASQDYNHIHISFEMKRGKIWSNIVRTMIGDSYFETRLPSNDIIAWVRGTVYEINLEGGYIHAVTHSMQLSDISGKKLSLLPGELVSSENIWVQKGKEILDTAWANWNTAIDTTYLEERSKQLKADFLLLSGEKNIGNLWDRFVRTVLSWFPDFSAIGSSQMLLQGDVTDLLKNSESSLIALYQKYQGTGFAEARDTIRETLMQKFAHGSPSLPLLESLKNGAIWDMIENNGVQLPGAKKLLDKSIQDVEWGIQGLRDTINSKEVKDTVKSEIKKWLSY